MMWLLLVQKGKAGWRVHSSHRTKERAEQWRECKEYEDDETVVLELTRDQCEDLHIELSKLL